jgi:hypothetical protein
VHIEGIIQRPWRRGVVVIVSADGTGDRGFESRQGERRLGNAVMFKLIRIFIVGIRKSEIVK